MEIIEVSVLWCNSRGDKLDTRLCISLAVLLSQPRVLSILLCEGRFAALPQALKYLVIFERDTKIVFLKGKRERKAQVFTGDNRECSADLGFCSKESLEQKKSHSAAAPLEALGCFHFLL